MKLLCDQNLPRPTISLDSDLRHCMRDYKVESTDCARVRFFSDSLEFRRLSS